MEHIEIKKKMWEVALRLEKAIPELNRLATLKAESERDYRKSLSEEVLKLRFEGIPATLIPDLAKGNASDLLFKRDVAEAKFTSAREAIGILQTQATLLQSILRTEESL